MTPVASAVAVKGRKVYVSGYPDNPDNEAKYPYVARHGVAQWEGSGAHAVIPQWVAKQDGRERLGYRIPTENGQSGSPAWMRFNSEGKVIRKMLAVHTDGGEIAEVQSGVLLTPKVLDDIKLLKQQPR
jgi:V8-like Glu-specific endopeptidase